MQKPVFVDAIQFTGLNEIEVLEWAETVGKCTVAVLAGRSPTQLEISVPDTVIPASTGDWLVRRFTGVEVCSPVEFDMMYQPIHVPGIATDELRNREWTKFKDEHEAMHKPIHVLS